MAAGGHGGRAHKLSRAEERRRGDVGRADWPHFTGFVDAPMLEKTMPPPGPDTYIFCCGPPPMIKSAIAKLEALGHDPSHVLCF